MKISISKPGRLVALGALLLLDGCAPSIETFQHPTQRETELAQAKSYCWNEGETPLSLEKIEPTGGHNPAFDADVRATSNEILAEKGYRLAPCSEAQFVMDYRMAIFESVAATDVSETDSIHDYGAKWRIGDDNDLHYEGINEPKEILIPVQQGTMHIVAFTANGDILWHHSAEKVLRNTTTNAKRLKAVRKATSKTMAGFPSRN